MSLLRVLIASPIRYRPECPEVLGEFLDGLAGLDWPRDRVRFWFIVQTDDDHQPVAELERRGYDFTAVTMLASPDSRLISGPRRTTETQLNLAYLRSRIFHYWEHETDADLCLMVDSDVVLAPGALKRMVDEIWSPCDHDDCDLYNACGRCGFDCCECERGQGTQRCKSRGKIACATVSLQLNNCPLEDGDPAANAKLSDGSRAPYATDGSVIEVARSGACTLYPRAAARCRFTFDPTRHHEEHEGLFDRLREKGFWHYLIRDPKLADHRMKREPDAITALRKATGRA